MGTLRHHSESAVAACPPPSLAAGPLPLRAASCASTPTLTSWPFSFQLSSDTLRPLACPLSHPLSCCSRLLCLSFIGSQEDSYESLREI